MITVNTEKLAKTCLRLRNGKKDMELYFIYSIKCKTLKNVMEMQSHEILAVSFNREEMENAFLEEKNRQSVMIYEYAVLGLYAMNITPYDVRGFKEKSSPIYANRILFNFVSEHLNLDNELRREEFSYEIKSAEGCLLVEWRHFGVAGYNEFIQLRLGNDDENEETLRAKEKRGVYTSILFNKEEMSERNEDELRLEVYNILCKNEWKWNQFSQERIKRYLKISQ